MESKYKHKISLSTSIARDTVYNLLSHGMFIGLAFWGIPIILGGLGEEKFGLFSLVLALIGYFSVLDFGISRANTKFLSEAIVKDDQEEISKIVWTSLTSTFLLGTISGLVIIATAPLLADNVFKINNSIRSDAILFFTISGIGTPFMLVFGTLKGFQMAFQRFDLVNIFQTLSGILQWVGSVILLHFGFSLNEVVLLTIGSRVILSFVAFFILPNLIPKVFQKCYFIDSMTLKKLWSFGGWITITQMIGPLFLYMDRVFIGVFLSLNAVAYYSIPQEALTRMLVLVISLTSVLFPAISSQSVLPRNENKTGELYKRSLKYITFVGVPTTFVFLIFAPEIINLWLGKDFADHSIIIFQIFAIGLFFNSIAQLPLTVLHAYNKPDVPAKLLMIEFPFAVCLNLLLIPFMGIIGAAIIWTLRVTVDSFLLFVAVRRRIQFNEGKLDWIHLDKKFQTIIAIAGISMTPLFFIDNIFIKISTAVIIGAMYLFAVWFFNFDDRDKELFLRFKIK